MDIKNPYIVGNPIKSEDMFFGREEDFRYIKEKLLQETQGIIITLSGDRRSGKTSILFQIMNGRLGENFLPFFVDMQAMASIKSTSQFLYKIDQIIRESYPGMLPDLSYKEEGFDDFELLVKSIYKSNPKKNIILLIDEYELIEDKIENNLISKDVITFFANLMEKHNVLFLFTGANKLEERNTSYWKTLFAKSQYRKITFLSKKDCFDLVAKPTKDFVNYSTDQLENIYRLTAGQPFYTQIVCQNIVDKLIVEKRADIRNSDLKAIIEEIVDNPMPQMIYFWQELSMNEKIVMSLLSKLLKDKESSVSSEEIIKTLNTLKLSHIIQLSELKFTLEALYSKDVLLKKGDKFQFRIDVFRYWIRREQDIWKLIGDLGLKQKSKKWNWSFIPIALIISIIGVLIAVSIFNSPKINTMSNLLDSIGQSKEDSISFFSRFNRLKQLSMAKADSMERINSYPTLDSLLIKEIIRVNPAEKNRILKTLPKVLEYKQLNTKFVPGGKTVEEGFDSPSFALNLLIEQSEDPLIQNLGTYFNQVRYHLYDTLNYKAVKEWSELDSLKCGDLLYYPNGYVLFFYKLSNRQLAIGMTPGGVMALPIDFARIVGYSHIKYIVEPVSEIGNLESVASNISAVPWYDPGRFGNNRDDLNTKSAFKILLPLIIQNKNLNKPFNQNGNDLSEGFNSENFAKHIFTLACNNGDKVWKKDSMPYYMDNLTSGNLLKYKNGYYLFYFEGRNNYNRETKKLAIGMTDLGIRALNYDFDAIEYVKAIETEDYSSEYALVLFSKDMRTEHMKGCYTNNTPNEWIFREIWDGLYNYMAEYQNGTLVAGQNDSVRNSQCFALFILIESLRNFNIQELNPPTPSEIISNQDLLNYLRFNNIKFENIESEPKPGDIVFFHSSGKDLTGFLFNDRYYQNKIVLFWTQFGIKRIDYRKLSISRIIRIHKYKSKF